MATRKKKTSAKAAKTGAKGKPATKLTTAKLSLKKLEKLQQLQGGPWKTNARHGRFVTDPSGTEIFMQTVSPKEEPQARAKGKAGTSLKTTKLSLKQLEKLQRLQGGPFKTNARHGRFVTDPTGKEVFIKTTSPKER
jgi:hypothetical protein